MPPDGESQGASHGNMPPGKQESLQYITYSAKELLYLLNQKVDTLDEKLDDIAIEHAKLDARYVTQDAFTIHLREAVLAKRFAVASVIASVGALGTFVGLLVNNIT
jgi:hypothetical protein